MNKELPLPWLFNIHLTSSMDITDQADSCPSRTSNCLSMSGCNICCRLWLTSLLIIFGYIFPLKHDIEQPEGLFPRRANVGNKPKENSCLLIPILGAKKVTSKLLLSIYLTQKSHQVDGSHRWKPRWRAAARICSSRSNVAWSKQKTPFSCKILQDIGLVTPTTLCCSGIQTSPEHYVGTHSEKKYAGLFSRDLIEVFGVPTASWAYVRLTEWLSHSIDMTIAALSKLNTWLISVEMGKLQNIRRLFSGRVVHKSSKIIFESVVRAVCSLLGVSGFEITFADAFGLSGLQYALPGEVPFYPHRIRDSLAPEYSGDVSGDGQAAARRRLSNYFHDGCYQLLSPENIEHTQRNNMIPGLPAASKLPNATAVSLSRANPTECIEYCQAQYSSSYHRLFSVEEDVNFSSSLLHSAPAVPRHLETPPGAFDAVDTFVPDQAAIIALMQGRLCMCITTNLEWAWFAHASILVQSSYATPTSGCTYGCADFGGPFAIFPKCGGPNNHWSVFRPYDYKVLDIGSVAFDPSRQHAYSCIAIDPVRPDDVVFTPAGTAANHSINKAHDTDFPSRYALHVVNTFSGEPVWPVHQFLAGQLLLSMHWDIDSSRLVALAAGEGSPEEISSSLFTNYYRPSAEFTSTTWSTKLFILSILDRPSSLLITDANQDSNDSSSIQHGDIKFLRFFVPLPDFGLVHPVDSTNLIVPSALDSLLDVFFYIAPSNTEPDKSMLVVVDLRRLPAELLPPSGSSRLVPTMPIFSCQAHGPQDKACTPSILCIGHSCLIRELQFKVLTLTLNEGFNTWNEEKSSKKTLDNDPWGSETVAYQPTGTLAAVVHQNDDIFYVLLAAVLRDSEGVLQVQWRCECPSNFVPPVEPSSSSVTHTSSPLGMNTTLVDSSILAPFGVYLQNACADHSYANAFIALAPPDLGSADEVIRHNGDQVLVLQLDLTKGTARFWGGKAPLLPPKDAFETWQQALPMQDDVAMVRLYNSQPQIPAIGEPPRVVSAIFTIEGASLVIEFDRSSTRGAYPLDVDGDLVPDCLDRNTEIVGQTLEICAHMFDRSTQTLLGNATCGFHTDSSVIIRLPRSAPIKVSSSNIQDLKSI
eukprot:GHVT01088082.1.p1 GENE.GHVT01088082.1~~GHVT01088082.1.p1  ORF type:complete len:1094 (-),score=54.93 GHVT01088082.1:288-3569(-)